MSLWTIDDIDDDMDTRPYMDKSEKLSIQHYLRLYKRMSHNITNVKSQLANTKEQLDNSKNEQNEMLMKNSALNKFCEKLRNDNSKINDDLKNASDEYIDDLMFMFNEYDKLKNDKHNITIAYLELKKKYDELKLLYESTRDDKICSKKRKNNTMS